MANEEFFISLLIGENVSKIIIDDDGFSIVEMVKNLRQDIENEEGFKIPDVNITDEEKINANSYQIKLFDKTVIDKNIEGMQIVKSFVMKDIIKSLKEVCIKNKDKFKN